MKMGLFMISIGIALVILNVFLLDDILISLLIGSPMIVGGLFVYFYLNENKKITSEDLK